MPVHTLGGVPTDYTEEDGYRDVLPDEMFEQVLRSDAFTVAKDFFHAMCSPSMSSTLAMHFLHTQFDSAKHGYMTCEEHAKYVFSVLVNEPLDLELVLYLGHDGDIGNGGTVYLFGTKHASLAVPFDLLSKSAEVSCRLLRLCMRRHTSVGSGATTSAAHERLSGGAFASIQANRRLHRVRYAGFAFNATFDVRFPRSLLIAQYTLSMLSHARSIDQQAGHAPATQGESSLYHKARLVLVSALRYALGLAHTQPVLRHMSVRVAVGTESRDQVRVVAEPQAVGQQERRVAYMVGACSPLLDTLLEANDGELRQVYVHVWQFVNSSAQSISCLDT